MFSVDRRRHRVTGVLSFTSYLSFRSDSDIGSYTLFHSNSHWGSSRGRVRGYGDGLEEVIIRTKIEKMRDSKIGFTALAILLITLIKRFLQSLWLLGNPTKLQFFLSFAPIHYPVYNCYPIFFYPSI